jgi:hypothetical protein
MELISSPWFPPVLVCNKMKFTNQGDIQSVVDNEPGQAHGFVRYLIKEIFRD